MNYTTPMKTHFNLICVIYRIAKQRIKYWAFVFMACIFKIPSYYIYTWDKSSTTGYWQRLPLAALRCFSYGMPRVLCARSWPSFPRCGCDLSFLL